MRTVITITPYKNGLRYVWVKSAKRAFPLGGYETNPEDSLRYALTLAMSYKREKSKQAMIVLAAAPA